MFAYVLVLLGILSRYAVASHLPWLNFTAVGGSLLFFGARRSWREMLFPLAALMASDYCLTTFTYHYQFHWQAYIITWGWYVMAMVLGQILLHAKTTFVRGARERDPWADFVLRRLQLRVLGEQLESLSAHIRRARHLLRGSDSLLPQRSAGDVVDPCSGCRH